MSQPFPVQDSLRPPDSAVRATASPPSSYGCAVLGRSVVSDSLRPHPWTVARQAPPSMELLQARILEWVAIPFSRGSSPTQGLNQGLPQCRWILCRLSHQGSRATLVRPSYPSQAHRLAPAPEKPGLGALKGQSLSLQKRERCERRKLPTPPPGNLSEQGLHGWETEPSLPSGYAIKMTT